MSQRINLGRVMPINKRAYSSSVSYAVMDIVEYEGSSYWCIQACQGVLPTNNTNWQIMSQKGADGSNGTNGVDGEDAYQPFKGWYDSSSSLSSSISSPVVGDYAYVMGASASDPVTVYMCSTAGTWTASQNEFNPANNQSFQTGQDLDQTKIINDLTTGGANHVLSAEAGKTLNTALGQLGPKIEEVYESVYFDSPNLFDKDAEGVLEGKDIEYNNGNIKDYANGLISDYIPVKAGKTYCVTAFTSHYGTTQGRNVAFYDSTKTTYTKLGGTLQNNSQYIKVNAQYDGYIRFCIAKSAKDTAMAVEGDTYPSEYIPYGRHCVIPEVVENAEAIEAMQETVNEVQESVEQTQETVSSVLEEGANLYDKDSEGITDGKYIEYNTNPGALTSNEVMTTSDYIPIVAGQQYIVKSAAAFYGTTQGRYVAIYNTSKTYTGKTGTLVDDNEHILFTASADGYMRFSVKKVDAPTAMMVKGDSYPSEYQPYGIQLLVPSFVKMQQDVELLKQIGGVPNPVYGKKILWLGDSIGEAASAGEGTLGTQRYGWSGRVAEHYNGTFYSLASSGNTITKNLGDGVGSILSKLEQLYNNSHTGDYLIIEGGTNDADRIGSILNGNTPEKLGTWDKNDFSGNYDEETFCGAVDSMFYKALTHYKGVKIGFIIAHKMGQSANTANNRRAYFDIIKEMCAKWGIPCLDLWNDTWLNPFLLNHYDPSKTVQENKDAGSYYVDGQHLTTTAYDYLATVIGEWLETI